MFLSYTISADQKFPPLNGDDRVGMKNQTVIPLTPTISRRERGIKEIFDLLNFDIFILINISDRF